jgi:SAM-dependent methyltransferase
MPSYDEFAPHFDAWQAAFGGAYDALILPRLLAALERHAPDAHRIADLGIGTGDLVVALAERGYEVIGVDVSRPMLAVATGKLAARGIHPAPMLLEQDIRELSLDPPVDACLCVYTVVNQLVDDGDLQRLFTGVHRSLVEDGIFVFELNLPAAYVRWWTGEDEVHAGGARVRRRHRRRAGGAVIEAEVTIESEDGRVTHDVLPQRIYADEEVERAIVGTGFTLVSRDTFDPFGGIEDTKALWVVRRGAIARGA